jgi:hypothetical protein
MKQVLYWGSTNIGHNRIQFRRRGGRDLYTPVVSPWLFGYVPSMKWLRRGQQNQNSLTVNTSWLFSVRLCVFYCSLSPCIYMYRFYTHTHNCPPLPPTRHNIMPRRRIADVKRLNCKLLAVIASEKLTVHSVYRMTVSQSSNDSCGLLRSRFGDGGDEKQPFRKWSPALWPQGYGLRCPEYLGSWR